jgi:hypothetical protein
MAGAKKRDCLLTGRNKICKRDEVSESKIYMAHEEEMQRARQTTLRVRNSKPALEIAKSCELAHPASPSSSRACSRAGGGGQVKTGVGGRGVAEFFPKCTTPSRV